MNPTRIYFEADHLKLFVEWVKTAPMGMCEVLIGADNPDAFKARELVEAVADDSRGTASAVLFMLTAGMMQVKVSEKVDLPVGVALETNQE